MDEFQLPLSGFVSPSAQVLLELLHVLSLLFRASLDQYFLETFQFDMHHILLHEKSFDAFVANVEDDFGSLVVLVGEKQAFLVFYHRAR